MTMTNTPEHTDPHGECAAEIARPDVTIEFMLMAERAFKARDEALEALRQAQAREAVVRAVVEAARNLEYVCGSGVNNVAIHRPSYDALKSALAHPALEGKT